MESKYVVTYRPNIDEKLDVKVMFGNELANLYGFSDCSGACEFHVWKMDKYGGLDKCRLRENMTAPYNLLCIQNERTMEIEIYEWPEH